MITGTTSTRELSLVEQKRLQWQKEREEIDRIGTEMFSHSQTKFERTSIKTYYSNVDLTAQFEEQPVVVAQRNFQPFPAATPQTYNNNFNSFRPPPHPDHPHHNPASRAMRSPSLPPIPREKFYNYPNSQTLIINPINLDTGYHSEMSPMNNEGPVEVWSNVDDDGRGSNKTVTLRSRARPDLGGADGGRLQQHFPENIQRTPDIKPLGTPNSLSSGQTFSTMSQSVPGAEYRGMPQRRKWNDTPQSYFDPMTRSLDSRSSQNVPYWLEKGLHDLRDSEDESVRSSHIRGQNVPLDPNVVAERADRRRKAMELQNGIKEQLLEQERMKKWEKEKRLQEEILAEEILRKQVEAERQRLEQEKRLQQEKVEKERRKAEIMRLAVEKAELEAKLEKERRKKQVKHAQEAEHEEDVIRMNGSRTHEEMNRSSPVSVRAPDPVVESTLPLERSPTPLPVPPPPQEIVTKSADIDGIALVLQSITPMMPLTSLGQATAAPQDFLGLNNSVNNLQIALLLAQQQQQLNMQARQLNTISSGSILSTMAAAAASGETSSPNTAREGGKAPNQSKSKESKKEDEAMEGEECAYCCRIHGGHHRGDKAGRGSEEKVSTEESLSNKKGNHEVTPLVTVEFELSPAPIADEEIREEILDASLALEVPKIPSDGTFIKEETLTLDTDTSTQTDGEISGNELVTWDNPRILTPRKYRASSKMLIATSEIGIQTDLLLLENCTVCTHKQLVLKEISQVTTSVTQTSSRRKGHELSPIRRHPCVDQSKDDREMTTTTVTTTTTIRAKANERTSRHNKKEPRPKWGVNQPAFQYVKASDRDPFCALRRRKKGQLKGFSTDHEDEMMGGGEGEYRKKADSGVSSNNGSLHSMDLYEDTDKEVEPLNSRRNMCTEILPITTDGNGQVFVNFREARLVQKDELAAGASQNNNNNKGREKIMEKRPEDLPFIPSVFRTERKLTKSASDSNYFPSPIGSPAVSKGDKEEINFKLILKE